MQSAFKMQNTTIDLEALLSVPSVTSFDISTDGRIVFCSNKSGQFELYLSKLTGEGLESWDQITSGEESKVSPKFLPDSSKVMYASDLQGDEKFGLYTLDTGTKTIEKLTSVDGFTIYPNAEISKDGKKIAYVSNQQGQFATYVLDIETGHSSRISYHDLTDQFAIISPDSRWVAYSSNVKAQEMGVFMRSLENPSMGVIKLEENGVQIDADQPAWSPDSKRLAFVSASKGMYDIGLWSFETNEIVWLTSSEHEHYEPIFSNGGGKLAYTVNSGGDIKLVIHDLEAKNSSVIEFKHGVLSSPKFSYDDRSVFFQFVGPRNPHDVWQYRIEDEKFVQITNSLPGDVEVGNFAEGEQILYPSKDGTKVPALIYMPNRSIPVEEERKGPKRSRGKGTRENLPAVIEIHGGPTSQALNSWAPFVQAMVAKGFVVLRPNYRGSTGYGKSFREANTHLMGEIDLADCVSARDFLIKRNLADPKKIGVTGGSFGGYLTMCCLTKYPNGWSCGSALLPFLNWFTEIKNEREELRFWDLQNMGDPDKDWARLRDASPIFFIDRVKAPVQIIAGAHDPRCPLEESEQARDELQKLGRAVDLQIYADEGHGFRKTRNKVDAYSKIIAFLEQNILREKKTS